MSSGMLLMYLLLFCSTIVCSFRVALWPRILPKRGRQFPKADTLTQFYMVTMIVPFILVSWWMKLTQFEIVLLVAFIVFGGTLAGHDARRGLLPDMETLLLGFFGAFWAISERALVSGIVGALLAASLFMFLNVAWRAFGRQHNAIGLGDVKLGAALGLWLGVLVIGHALALAALFALMLSPWVARRGAVRFGPFLILAAFIVLLTKLLDTPLTS